MIEEALFTRLSTFAGLTALVGTRVYPVELPQAPILPAVTYERDTTERPRVFGGVATGLAAVTFRVDSYAETYAGARAVGLQVRAALQEWRGTVAGVDVQDSRIETEADSLEPAVGQGLYMRHLTARLWHRE